MGGLLYFKSHGSDKSCVLYPFQNFFLLNYQYLNILLLFPHASIIQVQSSSQNIQIQKLILL